MNWYKISQIWNVQPDPQYISDWNEYDGPPDDFEGEIEDVDMSLVEEGATTFLQYLKMLYEIEFKYSFLKSSDVFINPMDIGTQFTGMPKRRENILRGLEQKAKEIIPKIIDPMKWTFEMWLASHALLEPKIWGKMRTKGIMKIDGDDYENILSSIFLEFTELFKDPSESHKYYWDQKERFKVFNNFMIEIYRSLRAGEMPVFASALEEIKELLVQDAMVNTEAEVSEGHMTEEEAKEEIERYKNMRSDDILEEYMIGDTENLAGLLEKIEEYNAGDTDDILAEIYSSTVFPYWYAHWKHRGIDQTRARVENAYKTLLAAQSAPISQALMNINIALNTQHQTGSMLAYLAQRVGVGEQTLRNALEIFSNHMTSEIIKWKKELMEIGVKMANGISSLCLKNNCKSPGIKKLLESLGFDENGVEKTYKRTAKEEKTERKWKEEDKRWPA